MTDPKVSIVDYNIGNLFSVLKACENVGMKANISSDKNEILNSDAIILPGVGAFPTAMHNLNKLDLVESIISFANSGRPLMGICLGMQLLLTESEELGLTKGLGIIDGVCKKFPQKFRNKKLKVPQINWNQIFLSDKTFKTHTPLDNIKNREYMYFVHSYYADSVRDEEILSQSIYGDTKYSSAIFKKNIFGFQFHPEKSGTEGLKIYKNFYEIIKSNK